MHRNFGLCPVWWLCALIVYKKNTRTRSFLDAYSSVVVFKMLIISTYCGKRGIRTPGGVTLNGFQDRRNRPLCHLSFVVCVCKVRYFYFTVQVICGIF